jgi:MscS family membrane protein
MEEVINLIRIVYNFCLQHRYLASLIIAVSFYILSRIAIFISSRFLMRLTKKTETIVDDLIVERTQNPISWLIMFVGARYSILILNVGFIFKNMIIHVIDSLVILTITLIIIRVLDIIIDNWGMKFASKTDSSLDDDVLPLIHKFANVFLVIMGFLFVLQEWGVQIGPFLASLGIAGLAIGFAVQDSLKNIFGGVSLIIDKNFKVGDTIQLDNGTKGKINDIGLRSTKIRSFNNEVIIYPNGILANTWFYNFAQPDDSARSVIEFGVEYGSDPEKVKKVAYDVVKKIPKILKEPQPFVRFNKMNDFSLDFKLYYWVPNYSDRFMTEDAVMTNLYQALNKAKIGIPFPTRTVYNYAKKR